MTANAPIYVVLVLALVAITAPVAGQSGGLSISVPAIQTDPGSEVNVTFEATNRADTASAAIVNITARPDWTVSMRQDAGGLWQDSGKWLFQTIEPGGTATPVLVLSVPESARGEYIVTAMITNGESSDTAETVIRVGQPNTQDSTRPDGGTFTGFPQQNIIVAGLLVVILLLLAVIARS